MPFNKLLGVNTMGYKNHKFIQLPFSDCEMSKGQIVASTAVLLLTFHLFVM